MMLFHHSLDGFNNTIEIVSKSIAILLEAVIRYFKKNIPAEMKKNQT
jgi:uncharacterized membrane protein required for colicin V production